MNKSILILSGLVLVALNSFAQKNSAQAANKLYFAKLYSQAIPEYEGILKKDSSNAEVLANLGDCYRLTNNTKGQLLCYGKLVQTGKAEDLHKLYYGEALMEAGRYDDAKKYVDEYKGDKRGESFSKAIKNISRFSKDADAYKLDTVSFNSKFDDFGAAFYGNDTVVFSSARSKTTWITKKHGWTGNNYTQVYAAVKGSDGKYGAPMLFSDKNDAKYNDGPICVASDRKTIYYTRNSVEKKERSLDGTYKLHIYQTSMVRKTLMPLTELQFNNHEFNCAHPAISADGQTIYFASDMGGGQGGMDIWYCKIGPDGAWGTPINLGDKVNTPGNELFPYITADNVLYFSSNGHEGLGGLDVYECKIKENKARKIYNMGKPVNSEFDDFAYNLSPDTKKAFLSSNRKTGGMNDDIYTVDVLRKVSRGKNVKFVIKDIDTQEPVADVKIKLNADSFMTNDKGEFETIIEEEIKYVVKTSKEKFFEKTDSISTKDSEEDEFTKNLTIERDPGLSLLAGIYDAKTGEGIPDVKITLKDLIASNSFELIKTDKNGEYKKPLTGKKIGDKLLYLVTIEKDGYVTKTSNFTYDIKKEGEIQLNELLTLTIGKVEVGMDLAKMIDIKPIYFDLGKSTIRKDAAVELDKIVEVMKQYPAMVVELGAHTDCRGAATQNLKLSDARAKASAAYIVKKGIEKTRITGKGYGESKLLNSCACEGKVKPSCSEDEHAKNRRTEFIIVKLKN